MRLMMMWIRRCGLLARRWVLHGVMRVRGVLGLRLHGLLMVMRRRRHGLREHLGLWRRLRELVLRVHCGGGLRRHRLVVRHRLRAHRLHLRLLRHGDLHLALLWRHRLLRRHRLHLAMRVVMTILMLHRCALQRVDDVMALHRHLHRHRRRRCRVVLGERVAGAGHRVVAARGCAVAARCGRRAALRIEATLGRCAARGAARAHRLVVVVVVVVGLFGGLLGLLFEVVRGRVNLRE